MTLVLYIKSWCPWCSMASEALDGFRVPYAVRDIEKDSEAAARMRALSGQNRVPTLEAGDAILADFGPEEVEPFLRARGLLPGAAAS
jgi:glutaredoxin 3